MLAKTRKECKEKLAAAMERAGKVDAYKTDQCTVGQWAEAWFENLARTVSHQPVGTSYKYGEHR